MAQDVPLMIVALVRLYAFDSHTCHIQILDSALKKLFFEVQISAFYTNQLSFEELVKIVRHSAELSWHGAESEVQRC